jgi:hypothetical protein
MKSICVSFLQKSEGSISNRLDFLSFTLQPLLVDVNQCLVYKMEMMINPMFVMLSFLLYLTFLQLLYDYLVHLLDPLNELAGHVFIYFFIEIDIFPIHQVQRDLMKIPKTCVKSRTLSGRI